MLLLRVARLVEIHEHGHERSLTVRRHEGNDLILNRLNAATNLFQQALFHHLVNSFLVHLKVELGHFFDELLLNFFARNVNERCKVRQRDRLATVLRACDLGDDLSGDVAGGGERVGFLN